MDFFVDRYDGVHASVNSVDMFESVLRSSLRKWEDEKRCGVWLTIENRYVDGTLSLSYVYTYILRSTHS